MRARLKTFLDPPSALQRAHELVNRHRDEMGWPASCANASRPSIRLAIRQVQAVIETGAALVKEAKGLGRSR
jgi:hypothetical protein